MKEKILKNKLRSAIIAAIVLIAAIGTVIGIKIEPNSSETITADIDDSEDKAQANKPFKPNTSSVDESDNNILAKDSDETVAEKEIKAKSEKESKEGGSNRDLESADSSLNNSSKEGTQKNPSKEEPQKKPEKEQPKESQNITAYISINCAAAVGNLTNPAVEPYVPADGGVLGRTAVTVPKGSSVYDVLTTACRNAGVQYDGSSSYITGIGHLYEFDAGPTSGWTYSVNGSRPNVGCGSYKLNGGEEITWNYVLSY